MITIDTLKFRYIIAFIYTHWYVILSYMKIDSDNPHRLLQSNILHLPQKLCACVHRLTFLRIVLKPFWSFSAPFLVNFLKAFEGWSNGSLQHHKASNNIRSGGTEQEWYGMILQSATCEPTRHTKHQQCVSTPWQTQRTKIGIPCRSLPVDRNCQRLGGKERMREAPNVADWDVIVCLCVRIYLYTYMNLRVKDGSHPFPHLAFIRICHLNWCH